MKKLKELQSLKNGTRKAGKLYPSTEKYLEEISKKWYTISVDDLYKLFTNDTTPVTTTTTAAAATTTTTTTTTKVSTTKENYNINMIVLDFSEAIEDNTPLPLDLKKKIRAFYRDRENYKTIMDALIAKVGSEDELMKYIL
jgi:hypothetical protein